MLITLTGAYRNAGDHLIGDRARGLLRKHVDEDVVNLDRREITEDHYPLFNKARAVILCGGPAYQAHIYPKVFPIELSRITSKVVPMGLGWKGNLDSTPVDFKFPEPAEAFIREVHRNIEVSSVRDHLTLEVLNNLGIKNVSMTGCPAWYDLEHLDDDYEFKKEAKKITFSLPAKPQPDTFDIIAGISKEFPKAEKVLAMHHGWRPSKSDKGNEMLKWHLKVFAFATSRGWKVSSIADGLEKFRTLYDETDLHVGYRVHAHIYSLSQQSASLLINEDSRGVGQTTSLGGAMLMAGEGAEVVLAAIRNHFETGGAAMLESTNRIKATYPTMVKFLKTL
jgi:hypothetical protein